LTIITGHIY